MQTVLLIAAFNAAFFWLLLLQKKQKSLHDKVLLWWLLYLAAYTTIYAFTFNFIFTENPLYSGSLMSLYLLQGPFLYLYIKPLATGIKKFGLNEWFHFLPFLAFNIYLAIAAIFPVLAEGINLSHAHHEGKAPLLFNFFLIITALSGPVYFFISYGLLIRAKKELEDNYSFSNQVDPSWLKRLVIIFGIIWTLLITIAVIHHVFRYFSLFFCTDGLSLTLSLFIILTGYFGLKQKALLSYDSQYLKEEPLISKVEPSKVKYEGSGIQTSEVSQIAQRLKKYMDESKPYLDPELTLPKLALYLDIPSHHLSRVINEYFSVNFFDYVNQYRIEEVKKMINKSEYNHLSILGIALECGFNSKSAFNRLFKKYTGLTPTEYKTSNELAPSNH